MDLTEKEVVGMGVRADISDEEIGAKIALLNNQQ